MKAFIFNSGRGSRLGALTDDCPKALVALSPTETLLSRQLRLLQEAGVREAMISTGYRSEAICEAVRPFEAEGMHIRLVHNPYYAQSNAIVSLALARDALLGDEVLMMHGDLVFDEDWLQKALTCPAPTLAATDATLPLNDKDFKARVVDGRVTAIGVDVFGDDCVNLMPFYKLSAEVLAQWTTVALEACKRGETDIYAETCANDFMTDWDMRALSYSGMTMLEVDTPEDLARAQSLLK